MKTKLIDIIDFERINLLLEGFNKATGFVTAILDLEGNILSKSGWRSICTDFHRVHPLTSARCTESDTCLAGQLAKGQKYNSYKCLNGLIDVAVPIIINGEHIGNLFTGQLFFNQPDKEFFRKQAIKFGFDEKIYLEAMDKIPVISEEDVKQTLDFLLDMTLLISEMTQQRIEQINLNEELKENEEKYRALFDNAPLSYQSLDEEGRFLDINPSWLRTLGYERNEVIGKYYSDFLHPDWKSHFEKNFPAFKKRGYIHDVQFKLRHNDGHFIDISFEGCIGYLPDGSFKQTYCVFQDITERRNTEEALKRSEYVLNETQRISKIGGWEYDVESGETYFSDEIFNIYGISDKKMFKSEEGLAFYHSDDRPLVSDSFNKAITQGIPYDIEVRFINAQRKNMWVRTAGKPVYKNKKIVKILGNLMDITERKMAGEKIQTQISELKRYNATMVDREIKMIQLKKEINDYCRQLNLPEKYLIPAKK